MIVSVIVRYTQSEWDSVEREAYDPDFIGIRADAQEAHAFARDCRMKDSTSVYVVRKIRIR